MAAIVVVTTVENDEQAELIARELVARRQAACVNIIPGVRSLYRWQGQIMDDMERLLIVKTTDERFDAVSATIHELHAYDVPEILSFDVARGDQSYLDWLTAAATRKAPLPDEESELPALD